MRSSPPTEQRPPEDDVPSEDSSGVSQSTVEDLRSVIQQVLEGLRDLKRVGLPSDELDRLKEKHPEVYEIHLAEQRAQPIHDREVELKQLELLEQQVEQTNAAQNAQRDVAITALEMQARWLSIAESNAKTGRALSWVAVFGLILIILAALAVNSLFVWDGKIDNLDLAKSVIMTFFGAGGLVAIVRALVPRRERSTTIATDEETRRTQR